MIKIKSFFRYLKKVLDYAIFLRNDYDWDYTYILRTLEYKLSRTRKEIEKHNRVVSTPQIVKNIKIAELVLQRLQKNDYEGFYTWDDIQNFSGEMIWEKEDGRTVFQGNYTKISNLEDKKLLTKLINKHAKHESYMWTQDYDFLTKHLRKHLRSFWD